MAVVFPWQMSDDHPFIIPEMETTLRKQIQECNWQVVNVTTPANYFHVLRRQVGANRCCSFPFFLDFFWGGWGRGGSSICLHVYLAVIRYTGNSASPLL